MTASLSHLPARADGWLILGEGADLTALSASGPWPEPPVLHVGGLDLPATAVDGDVAVWTLTPAQVAAITAGSTRPLAHWITVSGRSVIAGTLRVAQQGTGETARGYRPQGETRGHAAALNANLNAESSTAI